MSWARAGEVAKVPGLCVLSSGQVRAVIDQQQPRDVAAGSGGGVDWPRKSTLCLQQHRSGHQLDQPVDDHRAGGRWCRRPARSTAGTVRSQDAVHQMIPPSAEVVVIARLRSRTPGRGPSVDRSWTTGSPPPPRMHPARADRLRSVTQRRRPGPHHRRGVPVVEWVRQGAGRCGPHELSYPHHRTGVRQVFRREPQAGARRLSSGWSCAGVGL